MTTENPTRVRLRGVRVDWPTLYKGQQFNGEGKFRCGATLIVPAGDPQHKALDAAISAAADLKWKDKAKSTLKAARAKDKVCLRDGEMKAHLDGYAGVFYLSANCAGGDTEAECAKPQVLDAQLQIVSDPRQCRIYRGCYVNALVDVYADSRFGDGVFATLVGIQFARDGAAFGTAPIAEGDFEAITEGADAGDLL